MIVTLVLIYTRLSYTCTVIVFILYCNCQGFMLGYSSKINNPIPNLIEVIVVIVVFK